MRLGKDADGFWRPRGLVRRGRRRLRPDEADILGPHSGGLGSSERRHRSSPDYGIERFYLPEGEGMAIQNDMRERPFGILPRFRRRRRAQIKALMDGDKTLFEEPLYQVRGEISLKLWSRSPPWSIPDACEYDSAKAGCAREPLYCKVVEAPPRRLKEPEGMKTAFRRLLAASAVTALLTGAAKAADSVTMHLISADGLGHEIGTVTLEDAPDGLLITPNLHDINAGRTWLSCPSEPLM